MREIKFRGYDFTKKVMIPFEKIRPMDYVYDSELDSMFYAMENHLHIMQYTGLKDKNGVEIYEGDILKVASDGYSNYISFDGAYCYVEYFDKICAFIGKRNKNPKYEIGDYFQLETRTTVEVVGNIYENPELLQGN